MAATLDIAKLTASSEALVATLNSIPTALADAAEHLSGVRDENVHLDTAYTACANCETAYNTDILPKAKIVFDMLSEAIPQLTNVYTNLNVNKRQSGNTDVGTIETIEVPDLGQFGA